MSLEIIRFLGFPVLLINLLLIFLARANRVLWWSSFSLVLIVIANSLGLLFQFFPLSPLQFTLILILTLTTTLLYPVSWQLSINPINTPLRVLVRERGLKIYLRGLALGGIIFLSLYFLSSFLPRFFGYFDGSGPYQILYGIFALLFFNMLFELHKTKLEIQSSSIMVWWLLVLSGSIYLLGFLLSIIAPYKTELNFAIFLLNNMSAWMLFGALFFYSQSEGYGMIFDQLHDSIFRVNSKGQLLNSNLASIKLFGFTGADFGKDITHKIQSIIPFEIREKKSQGNYQQVLQSGDQKLTFFVDTHVYETSWEGNYSVIAVRDITDEVSAQNGLKQKISELELLYKLSTVTNKTGSLQKLFQQTCDIALSLMHAEQIVVMVHKPKIWFLYGDPILEESSPVLEEVRSELALNGKFETQVDITDRPVQSLLNNQYWLSAFQLISTRQKIGEICFLYLEQNRDENQSEFFVYQIVEQLSLAISKILLLDNLEQQIDDRTKELLSVNKKLQDEIAEKEKNSRLLIEKKASLENLVKELNYINHLNRLMNQINLPLEEALRQSVNIITDALFKTDEGGVYLKYHSHLFQSENFSSDDKSKYVDFPGLSHKRRLSDNSEFSLEIKAHASQNEEIQLVNKNKRFLDTVFEQMIVFVENKLANKQLEDNLEFLQVMVETIPHPVLYKDRASNYLGCNQLFASQLFGMDKKEILGKSALDFAEILDPENARTYIKKDQELFNNPGIQRYEASVDCKDGVLRDFLYNRQTFQNSKGDVVGIVGIMVDITSMKQITKDLSRLAIAVESAAEAVVMMSVSGKIGFVNQAFADILGLEKENIIHQNFEEFLGGNDDHDFYQEMLKLNQEREIWTGHFVFMNRDGQMLEHSITSAPIIEAAGEIRDIVLVMRDLTKQRIMEQRLNQAQKLESIGQLAAGIAHEINTPTQYVYNNFFFLQDVFSTIDEILNALTEYVKRDGNYDKEKMLDLLKPIDLDFLQTEIPAALASSVKGLERVSKIVLAMKEFSYPGTVELVLTDVNHNIENTITVSRNEWKYVSDLKFEKQEDLPQVLCLPGELNQVILNLIVNAAHAIEEHKQLDPSVKGQIIVRSLEKNGFVQISVSDNGLGIPENIQNKIFDPFFTTKKIGKGTGQGLTIAYDVVVNKLKGRIWFETVENEGTTFFIDLPCENCQDENK